MLRKALFSCLLLFASTISAISACGDGASTCWWVGGGSSANWNATGNTNWGTASNTRDNAGPPATGDDLCFDGTANGNTASTLNTAFNPKSIDFTGCGGGGGNYTQTLTHNSSVTLTIGSAGKTGGVAKWSSGMTYTRGSATTSVVAFDGDGGTNAFTTGGKTFGNITIGPSNAGVTVQLQDALTGTATSTFALTRGTFDMNNQNVSFGLLDANNTNTRVFTMGSGTWTATGTVGGVFHVSSAGTGLTVTANTGTVSINATPTGSRQVVLAGKTTWNILSIAAGFSYSPIQFTAFGTVATLNVTAPNYLQFPTTTTSTITNAATWTGTAANPIRITVNNNENAQCTVVFTGGGTIAYAAISGLIVSTGAVTASNSTDLKNNGTTGGGSLTITAPSGGSAGIIGGGF